MGSAGHESLLVNGRSCFLCKSDTPERCRHFSLEVVRKLSSAAMPRVAVVVQTQDLLCAQAS